jgi:hypothetical protein
VKYTVIYNPEFYNDIEQAVEWYNKKLMGLGDRFFIEVKHHTASLSSCASQYAIKYDDIRCMGLKRFPYLIHFRIDEYLKSLKLKLYFIPVEILIYGINAQNKIS